MALAVVAGNPPQVPVIPSPIVLQAARIVNGDVVDQGDINQMFAGMIMQQQAQRQNDIDVSKEVGSHLASQVRNHRQQLDVLESRLAQNGADRDEVKRQINDLKPKVEAGETLLKNIEDKLKRPGGLEEIANVFKKFQEDKAHREKVISETVDRIRKRLEGQIKDQHEEKDFYTDEMFHFFLFAIAMLSTCTVGSIAMPIASFGPKAATATVTKLLGVSVSPNVFFLSKALFHGVKEEHLGKVLQKYDRYVAQGLSPEFALEMARK